MNFLRLASLAGLASQSSTVTGMADRSASTVLSPAFCSAAVTASSS